MSRFSLTGWRWLSIIPGLGVGILIGLLLTTPSRRQASSPSKSNLDFRLSDVDELSPAELETLTVKTLSKLREQKVPQTAHQLSVEGEFVPHTTDGLRRVQLGIKNVRRLLPLAKRLLLESLREAQTGDQLQTSGLSSEERLINNVQKIVLDQSLIDMSEVRDNHLLEIRIGSYYASFLISDDEAIFLLGHELMHVAARSGRLNQFIENVSEAAKHSASIEVTAEQKEDLACDFTGALVLKRFITLYPTEQTETDRFSRAFGYESPSERIARAWVNFCTSYDGDAADEDHLSQGQTMRALSAIDPELKALIPIDSTFTMLCH